ncbi:hypothetical protein HMPREF0063_11583 [Aeromicrobium marinum DSM 15272]|uniref:DUF4328 domain-containing protein n=1 Tax=Aeromicrobium marinum DSM 15272 TaxID=585531 RepID=E2SC24_9ACTN|nr:DUF4328 domain-containing protein [Aeromicrobium marinum]EFQ83310.1 hypothetical protein HMPREF0063_11583 [Aeromicrobium marinum DSM 15272]
MTQPPPVDPFGHPVAPPPPPYPAPTAWAQPQVHRVPRRLGGPATAAIVAAGALTLLGVLEAGFAWSAQAEYLEAAREGRPGFTVLTTYDLLAVAWLPALVACFVTTGLWLHRARTNVEALHPHLSHARSAGWAWGGWVVPFVSLWFPYQVVRDVSRDPASGRSSPLIGWWWAAWLVFVVSDAFAASLVGYGAPDPTTLQALGAAETWSAATAVVGFTLWVLVVRDVTARHRRLLEGRI